MRLPNLEIPAGTLNGSPVRMMLLEPGKKLPPEAKTVLQPEQYIIMLEFGEPGAKRYRLIVYQDRAETGEGDR